MPVDRGVAVDLAENVVTLYQQAETRLAADLARRLASGMGSPTWAEDKLRGLTTLRQFSQNLVSRLNGALADEVAQATILAYVRGGNSALDDLGRAQSTHPEWLRAAGVTNPNDRLRAMIARRQAGVAAQLAQARRALPGADAIARLAFNLTTRLQGTHLRIARWQLDSYREVVAAGSAPDVLLGLATRRRASQVAWERLLSGGITGFVDRSGRGWNLASYVEMATRSTVAQAAVEGHLDRLSAAGLDLVIVSNAPQECEKCRPWEGKILARKGPDGKRTVQVEHGTRDGELVDVEVRGSVDEAISAGLMHPNCRHSLSAYMAGVTRIPTNTEDPEGDAARQKLRALERKVRGQKLKAETAIDPAAKAGLEAKVRATQGQIREHVKATGLHRQPTREQIDLGHRPPPGPVDTTPPSPPPAPAPTPPAPRAPKPKAPPKPPAAARPYHGDSIAGVEDLADIATTAGRRNSGAQRERLLGGMSARTERVTLPDGRTIVHKRGEDWGDLSPETMEDLRHQADAEQLSDVLARAVDAPAARVYRNEQDAIWMEYIDEASQADATAAQIRSPEGLRIGLLDVLTGNHDRNSNYLLRNDRPVAIDHGWNWHPERVSRDVDQATAHSYASPFVDPFVDGDAWAAANPLSAGDVTLLRGRLEANRADFARLGREDWLNWSLRILDQLGQRATGGGIYG